MTPAPQESDLPADADGPSGPALPTTAAAPTAAAFPTAEAVAAVVDLARRLPPRCADTRIVAIDGLSGAGKTTLAAAVAVALDDPPVLHLDDLYPGWDGLAAGVRRLHHRVLERLAKGEQAAYRRFDWGTGGEAEEVEVRPVPLLVIEGVGCSVSPCGAYESVRVWLDAERGTRRTRGLARDGGAYRTHWEQWARAEAELYAGRPGAEGAHLVLDTTG